MPEVTDIIAANGDVWRVRKYQKDGADMLRIVLERHSGPYLLGALHIPAYVLPRVAEALSKLSELSQLSQLSKP